MANAGPPELGAIIDVTGRHGDERLDAPAVLRHDVRVHLLEDAGRMYRLLGLTGPLQRRLDRMRSEPLAPEGTKPEREYLILFTARSGSSHLTQLLASAGVGDPREWLNPRFLAGQAEFLGARSFEDYFAAMRARFSPNGVFGHEMTMGFHQDFSREVRLEDHFDFGAPTIFLYREDIVQQAVSLTFASHRNVFHNTGGLGPGDLGPVPYSVRKIRHSLLLLAGQERQSLAFLDRHAAPVRYLSYEALVRNDPRRVVRAISDHVGAKPDLAALSSDHRKLGDQTNLEHAERFARDQGRLLASVFRRRRRLLQRAMQSPLI